MALITCHECSNQVSNKAASCPHCGAPIHEQVAVPKKPQAGKSKKEEANEKVYGVVGISILFILVFAWIVSGWDKQVSKSYKKYNDSQSKTEEVRQAFEGEFLTMNSCLSAINELAGGPLKIITDKPQQVSGRLPDDRFFICSLEETHTKGVFFQGHIAAE